MNTLDTQAHYRHGHTGDVLRHTGDVLTADQHDADGEDLLRVGVGGNVTEAHAGQAAEGKVKRCDVFILGGGAGGRICVVVWFNGKFLGYFILANETWAVTCCVYSFVQCS